MNLLADTVTDIVRKLNPTVLCMCEVGDRTRLNDEQMRQVADQCKNAWRDAATEHVKLRSMYTTGQPFLTTYVEGAFTCSKHRTLHDLYYAHGEPRTAQAFVLFGPNDESIDVINVHAPSGTNNKLKDSQRRKLVTNLLRSNSEAMPGRTVGCWRFLVGGDMNTFPFHDVSTVAGVQSKLLITNRGNNR